MLLAKFFSNHLQTLGQLGFEAPRRRPVIFALDAEIVLRSDASLGVMSILITDAVPQALGARIVRVAQMYRHRQHATMAHVAASLFDRNGRGIRFRSTGQIRYRLSQRKLAFGQADELAGLHG